MTEKRTIKPTAVVVSVDKPVLQKSARTTIDTSSNEGLLGPTLKQTPRKIIKKAEKRKQILGVIFGPGVNRSIGHVAFLKASKRKELDLKVVSGVGLGAVTATLYAQGKKPDSIEWFYYKFFNEVKGLIPYSRKWRMTLIDQLNSEFGRMKYEELSLTCIIPLYNEKKEKVEYKLTGGIVDILSKALKLYSTPEDDYLISPLQRHVFSREQLNNFGVDEVYGVDVLGENVRLKKHNDFIMGTFSSVIEIIKEENKTSEVKIVSLPMGDMYLDSTENLPKSLQKSYSYSLNEIEKLKNQDDKQVESLD